MRKTEQWMELATESEAVEALTARGDQPMLPELYRSQGNWRLRIWYFGLEVGNRGLEYRGLRCRLTFDLKEGRIVSFEEMEGEETGLTGRAMELIEPEYEQCQKNYISAMDEVLALLEKCDAESGCTSGTAEVDRYAEKLHQLWLNTIPELFRTVLKEKTAAVHGK